MLPTSSMSGVRKHFWTEVRRLEGGCSSPRKYGLKGCIPATVRSVEVSSGAGISDADGTRRWSRSSKNERYASRISLVFTRVARSFSSATGRCVMRFQSR